jgi:hypothetical protein
MNQALEHLIARVHESGEKIIRSKLLMREAEMFLRDIEALNSDFHVEGSGSQSLLTWKKSPRGLFEVIALHYDKENLNGILIEDRRRGAPRGCMKVKKAHTTQDAIAFITVMIVRLMEDYRITSLVKS